jgi:mycofactocin precursor
MSESTKIAEAPAAVREPDADATADAEPRAEEMLIEEVSIDGMCGVY